MKKQHLHILNNQKGLIGAALISLLLGAVAILGIFYSAITNSSEYNKFHSIAREVADDPSSHTDEEILNSGEALYKMMRDTVDSGTTGVGGSTGGGLGVKVLVQVEDALRKVRLQQYVIKISANPADPAPYQDITITLEILNSTTGTSVSYSLVGTDGYTQSDTLTTDESGTASFTVPGGAEGVTDTFEVTVGSVTESYSYSF